MTKLSQQRKQLCLLCDKPTSQDGGMLCGLCRKSIDTPAASPALN